MPIREESFALESPRGGRIDGDVRFPEEAEGPLPVVLFCHGFKGFKDWGPFPVWARFLAEAGLAEAGLAAVTFNFSYDGVAAETPTAFTELDKFAENTYTRELDDLTAVIDAAADGALPGPPLDAADSGRLGLMGHSRGGGTAILQARHDARVQALVTWSAVSGFVERFSPEQIDDWEQKGYTEVLNSRTGQTMRLNRDLYDDALAHRDRLDILGAARALRVPWLIVHARDDEAVPFTEAEDLESAAPEAELMEAAGGHTFGGAHPFDGDAEDVPETLRTVWERTRRFFADALDAGAS